MPERNHVPGTSIFSRGRSTSGSFLRFQDCRDSGESPPDRPPLEDEGQQPGSHHECRPSPEAPGDDPPVAQLPDHSLLKHERCEEAVIQNAPEEHGNRHAKPDDRPRGDHDQAHVPGDRPLGHFPAGQRPGEFKLFGDLQKTGIPGEGTVPGKPGEGAHEGGDPQAPGFPGGLLSLGIERTEHLGGGEPAREFQLFQVDHLALHGDGHHHPEDCQEESPKEKGPEGQVLPLDHEERGDGAHHGAARGITGRACRRLHAVIFQDAEVRAEDPDFSKRGSKGEREDAGGDRHPETPPRF